jgi:hypothetical protein
MAHRRMTLGINRNQFFVMKQLSNTPEAAAAITGLRGDALRDRVRNLFGRASHARGRDYRNIAVPRFAQALVQEMVR